jgi:hypothetical protein
MQGTQATTLGGSCHLIQTTRLITARSILSLAPEALAMTPLTLRCGIFAGKAPLLRVGRENPTTFFRPKNAPTLVSSRAASLVRGCEDLECPISLFVAYP